MTMKTHLNLVLVFGLLFVISSASAQNTVSAEVPAPALVATAPALVPSQVIYSPRLPTPVELTNAAAAQGVAINRIEQTATQVTVAYKFSDGQTKTVAYLLLPSPGAAPAPVPVVVPASTPVTTTTVYYDSSPRVIYYEPSYYPYSYARDWYPPVSLSLGLGFGFHGGGGYYRGGFHGRR
jgi:hypothetical protein